MLRKLETFSLGVVLATGIYMVAKNCFGPPFKIAIDWQSIIITILLAAILFAYKKIRKKHLSPIILIIISAVIGTGIFAI